MLTVGCQTSAVPILLPELLDLCQVIIHQVLTPCHIDISDIKVM